MAVPFARMDIPTEQRQKDYHFDLEKMGHTVFYGSPGFGKSLALQTLVLNLARLNTPEQVQINLFDFGTNGLLPLKDLPHVVDLTRFDEEEKLIKFLKRIDQELKIRKEKFALYNVASLSQYEQKSGEKLPAILTIFDGFDTIKDTPLEEAIESTINRLLREGASLGCYVILTVLRSNSLKISMSSNITSRLAFYLVDEGASKEIIGRDALIQQEIFGRAQLKEDVPYAIQVYLPISGEGDIERLYNLEEEVKLIARSWTGVCPEPIPMLPNEVTLDEFKQSVTVQEMMKQGQIPIGYDKETTKVVGFNPKKHGYFVIMDDTPQQTELLEAVLLMAFENLNGQAQRILFDIDGRLANPDSFDSIILLNNFSTALTDLVSEIERRLHGGDNQMMFVYMPDIHTVNEKMLLSANVLETIIKNASKAGVYFIFHGYQKNIESKFDEFSKRLRANMPAGIFGTRFMDQGMIKGKSNYKETLLEVDETHFFVGREVCRIKLPR